MLIKMERNMAVRASPVKLYLLENYAPSNMCSGGCLVDLSSGQLEDMPR